MAEIDCHSYYSCINCRNPVALRFDLLSKDFLAKSGPAYLFSYARNIIVGISEERNLLSGVHTIADISCSNCGEVLGWKYIRAYDIRQKYKEGKFILERAMIAKEY
ncbi:protein yippee-like At4g27745 [Ziziphus jujuba]|uniref:Protein yippee-like n=1 Tax=Ziziphus jujuba TaxID=326968 RepID=A0ABM4AFZ1_ZIZJJ|nr:protein yippee-like At4g27745 [Ziziphus jujuba]